MDNYSKAVLTVIAACLVFQVADDLIVPAKADDHRDPGVRITNLYTAPQESYSTFDKREVLVVRCENCTSDR